MNTRLTIAATAWLCLAMAAFGQVDHVAYRASHGAGGDELVRSIERSWLDEIQRSAETSFGAATTGDSVALVALYNAWGGSEWTDATGWLSSNVSEWKGVTVTNGRVTGLDLSGNQLTGAFPNEIGDLDGLWTLTLGDNRLTGDIPSTIGNLTDLLIFIVSGNELSGSLPEEISGMSRLRFLSVAGNDIEGEIPFWLSQMGSLEFLALGSNRFSGPLPAPLGDLSKLKLLSLGGNDLVGEIPQTLSNLGSLEAISLQDNNLTGSAPGFLGTLPNLIHVELARNQLTGQIPASLISRENLEVILLDGNDLTGDIPSGTVELTRLKALDLSNNGLSGPVPLILARAGAQAEQDQGCSLQNNDASLCMPDTEAYRSIGTAICGLPLQSTCTVNVATENPDVDEILAANVFPNPAHGALGLSVVLPDVAEVAIRVFDATGRVIGSRVYGRLVSGEHRLSMSMQGAVGPVFYEVAVGDRVLRGGVVVVR